MIELRCNETVGPAWAFRDFWQALLFCLFAAGFYFAPVLLLFAGISKLLALTPVILLGNSIATEAFVLILAFVETIVGASLIYPASFSAGRLAKWIAVTLFAFFSTFMVLQLWFGPGGSACQCFGGTGWSPRSMILLDVYCMISLICYDVADVASKRKVFKWLDGLFNSLQKCASMLVGVAAAIGIFLPFGFDSLIHFGFGQAVQARVIPQLVVSKLNACNNVLVPVQCVNMGRSEVTVIGVKTSCGCESVFDLPGVLKPLRPEVFQIQVFFDKTTPPIQKAFGEFYLSDGQTVRFHFSVLLKST